MRRLGLGFDLVLASPARRVVETIEAVAAEFGPLPAEYDERLYLASPQMLLDVIHEAPANAASLLLIGHNPGLESLALLLADAGPLRSELAIKYPTATLAEIALPIASWAEVRGGAGELRRFIRPRDLDPELGPED
jgi:phosphohistidine phosphatase